MIGKKKRLKLSKDRKNKDSQVKKPIPDEFITHIVKLGFAEKDAARLYEIKDDWLGMSSGGKILCTEIGCKFTVPLSSDALFEHCRTVHGWRDYPCTHDNCNYVAYSAYSYKKHMSQFHSPYRKHNGNYFSCPRPDCKAAFERAGMLTLHEKIHTNDVFRCLFCPYGNADMKNFTHHQRMHFNTRDCVCHVCNKTFTTTTHLNLHILKVHNRDQTKTQCPLCDKVAVKHKIQVHLNGFHKVLGSKWDDKLKQYIVPKQV